MYKIIPVRIFFVALIALTVSADLHAQTDSVEINNRSILANIDSLRIAQIELGKVKFTPFIAPSYSPELEVLFSAGGLLTFKIQKDNPVLERSSIPFSIGYSTNGSLQASAKFILYGKDDKIRIGGEWWLKNMPDNYWGVGYDKGRHVPKSDSTTQYQRDWWQLKQKIMIKVKPNFFIGPILDMSRTEATQMNPTMINDPNIVEYGSKIRTSGIGIVTAFDSRDLAVNAYEGIYLDLSATFYGNYLRGSQKYQVYELDYRQYKTLGKERRTLAWNLKTRASFGAVPWPELSQLGNPFDFRGYTWGRYRDESMIIGMTEYRHMFNRRNPNKKGSLNSRFGFTAWTGIGSAGTDVTDFKHWLPTFGIGLRLETQQRMNVRIDWGLGADSSSFYVNFNEAF